MLAMDGTNHVEIPSINYHMRYNSSLHMACVQNQTMSKSSVPV